MKLRMRSQNMIAAKAPSRTHWPWTLTEDASGGVKVLLKDIIIFGVNG